MCDEHTPRENWRPVVGYEGLYEVSDLGHVYSISSKKILKTSRNTSGYPSVKLYKNGQPFQCPVHREVAYAFIGPRPKGHQINHINYTRSDARACNLEYLTMHNNVAHSLHRVKKGVDLASAKLNHDSVAKIRQMRSKGIVYRIIAEEFKVDSKTVRDLLCGKTWRHIP